MSFRYPSTTVLLSWYCKQKWSSFPIVSPVMFDTTYTKAYSHKSYSLEQSLVFHSFLDSCFPLCLVGVDFPQSPLQTYDDLMSLYQCVPLPSFVCLLVSSCARQMFMAFCRSRCSSCILSVTENTILSRNIQSFISPQLHKFARDLKS